MKNILLVLLLVIVTSCGTTTSVTRSYYDPYDNYGNYYYNSYPYGSYGFGLGWNNAGYYKQHQFIGEPQYPKDREKYTRPIRKKDDDKQRYRKPEKNNEPRYNVNPLPRVERQSNEAPRNDSRIYNQPSNEAPRNDSRSYSSPSNNTQNSSPAPSNNSGGGNSGGSGSRR